MPAHGTRVGRLLAWIAAANALAVLGAAALTPAGGHAAAGVRAFAAWCGIG